MHSPLVGLIGAVVGGLLVVLAIKFLPALKRERQGYPLEAQVEAALLTFVFQGICAGYRVSEMAMDELGTRLRGADKKAIANVIYDLLPADIAGFPLEIVKSLVTRKRFAELVQDAFDRFDAGYTQFQAEYEEAYHEWVEEYKAAR